MKTTPTLLAALLLSGLVPVAASAQTDPPAAAEAAADPAAQETAPVLTMPELKTLVGPYALYPDPLLAPIFAACTVPQDVQAAQVFLDERNSLDQAEAQPWDKSLKTLIRYPDVLKKLSGDLARTAQIGEAFLYQQAELLAAVQELRQAAYQKGNLKTNKQQKVVVADNTIAVEPAEPDVVYVPTYNPEVVYTQEYDAVSPIVTYGGAAALGYWLYHGFDWRSRYVGYGSGWWRRGEGWNRGPGFVAGRPGRPVGVVPWQPNPGRRPPVVVRPGVRNPGFIRPPGNPGFVRPGNPGLRPPGNVGVIRPPGNPGLRPPGNVGVIRPPGTPGLRPPGNVGVVRPPGTPGLRPPGNVGVVRPPGTPGLRPPGNVGVVRPPGTPGVVRPPRNPGNVGVGRPPVVNTPVIKTPKVKPPVVQRPVVQRPVVQRPVVQRPPRTVVQRPVVQRPVVQRQPRPVVQRPVVQRAPRPVAPKAAPPAPKKPAKKLPGQP